MENDIKVLKELYKFICVSEGIKAIALKFCKVGRGGACCSYVANKPKSISIDLNRINVGSAYALCHEVAHQICIANEGNATHNAKFKKMKKDLVKTALGYRCFLSIEEIEVTDLKDKKECKVFEEFNYFTTIKK